MSLEIGPANARVTLYKAKEETVAAIAAARNLSAAKLALANGLSVERFWWKTKSLFSGKKCWNLIYIRWFPAIPSIPLPPGHGITAASIVRLNRFSGYGAELRVGQTILIPPHGNRMQAARRKMAGMPLRPCSLSPMVCRVRPMLPDAQAPMLLIAPASPIMFFNILASTCPAYRKPRPPIGAYVKPENLLPGDLVFFSTPAGASVGHVGIYIGGRRFLHAVNVNRGVATGIPSMAAIMPSITSPRAGFRCKRLPLRRVSLSLTISRGFYYNRERRKRDCGELWPAPAGGSKHAVPLIKYEEKIMSVYDVLEERGYIEQCTHEKELRELLNEKSVTFYIGFDPTADSLHVGHYVQVMVIRHMQQAGHKPIALLGGGTGMVGDPSGRSDLRQLMTVAEIDENCRRFHNQLARFVDFGAGQAISVNNADWLRELKYIDFLREVGSQFSVNRMLTAECFKARLERGLSFLEFNYMLMQSYDFLELYRRYNCQLQLGGNDQWSNIINGVDLVRRLDGGQAFGLTFKLLTTSAGQKMGKTAKGALWIDERRTSPYDFYHYWRNVDDSDVENCLALLTFLPMDEVRRLGAYRDAKINEAKEVLAYEVTKLVHGEEKAKKAAEAERALFSSGGGEIPAVVMDAADFAAGMNVIDAYLAAGLVASKGDGRRLIEQGGAYIKEKQIGDIAHRITLADFEEGKLLLKKGKKTFKQIQLR